MQFVLEKILRDSSMYRKQMAEQEMASQEKQFITCVGDLPVVNSAWNQVSDLYIRTKSYNPLFNYTLGFAENSLKKVVDTAQPLVVKYDGPIKYVNNMACDQLDHLKETYPVITKPTQQVIQDSKEKCTALIKPAVDRINAVKDFGVNAYTKSTQSVSNVAHTATDYSKQQLSRATSYGEDVLNSALHTTYGQVVNDKVNDVLTFSETYIDKYLPPVDTEAKEPVDDTKNALVHAGNLTYKLRQRMYSKAMRDLHNVKVRSTETLAKLNFTVDLIQYAKSNLDGAKTRVGETMEVAQSKLWDTWAEINKEEMDGTNEKEGTPQSLEKRGIIVARHLLKQLKTNVNSLESIMVEMPGTLQDKYTAVQQYTDQLWMSYKELNSVNEIPSWMLNQTKNQLSYITETLSFLTEQAFNMRPLNWMTIEVDLDNLNLQEIEHMWTHDGNIRSINGRIRNSETTETEQQ